LQAVNHDFLAIHRHDQIVVDIVKVEDNSDVSRQDTNVEMDEMWSYIGCKDNQRWLWHAVGQITGKVLAYVLGRRRDEVFLKLKDLLEPLGVTHFYTDDWGACKRHLDPGPMLLGNKTRRK